jgi:hypothetical protein
MTTSRIDMMIPITGFYEQLIDEMLDGTLRAVLCQAQDEEDAFTDQH